MKVLKDYQGREVRLTDERRGHILEHEQGNLLGFSIMQVSRLSKGKPLVAELAPA
jgi:hypothetical protein